MQLDDCIRTMVLMRKYDPAITGAVRINMIEIWNKIMATVCKRTTLPRCMETLVSRAKALYTQFAVSIKVARSKTIFSSTQPLLIIFRKSL